MITLRCRMLLLANITLAATQLYAAHTDDDARLLQQYQAPEELANLLDQAYEDNEDFRKCIHDRFYGLCKCPDGMACYIKKNMIMQRIQGWEKAHQVINEKKLDEIVLPQKYLWNGFVVAETLQPTDDHTLDGITKRQLAQLLLFAHEGHFGDFIGGKILGTHNVFFTKGYSRERFWKQDMLPVEDSEKKIALIDTKLFGRKNDFVLFNNVWELFSQSSTTRCDYRTMIASGDLDWRSRPNDFELFWQKYKECFQAQNFKQN